MMSLALSSEITKDDDHARNHAAFWNGEQLTLTPAYDICPQSRTGGEASQSMNIHKSDKLSRLVNCLASTSSFVISEDSAKDLIQSLVTSIKEFYPEICQEAGLSEVDQKFFWRRQFLNPYCFYGLPEEFENTLTSICDS